MSLSMRPVREQWGEATSLFLDSDTVVALLVNVSDSLGITYGLDDKDQGAEVIIHEGGKFLDHVESEEFTPATAQRLLNKTVDEGDLASLVENLKSLADNWRGFLDADELRILVD